MEFYVSTLGDDRACGSAAEPVKTLKQAAALVRTCPEKGRHPVTVHIEEGVYYLEQPLTLGEEDGGTKGAPVIYQGDGKAVISGAVRLHHNWQPCGNGIWQMKVDEGQEFDQLFINGKKKILARYPNYNPNAGYFSGYAADSFEAERLKKYHHPEGGFMHAMHEGLWGDFHYQITGRDEDGNPKYIGGWQNNRPSDMHKTIRYIENIKEELTSPGEWFLDKTEHCLYYIPEEGECLADAVCEGAVLKNLITVCGGIDRPAEGITFRNLTITHTGRTFMEPMEAVLRSDWCIYRGGTILLENSRYINIEKCCISAPGGNGITVSRYNDHAVISGCEITEAGASAILIAGDKKAVRSPLTGYEDISTVSDWEPGPQSENYPRNCLIEDNLIVRNGRVEKQSAGICLTMCSTIWIRHNTIYDVPRAGINICDGTWGGHVIEYNTVFDTVKETSDHGAFNSWGRDRYWDYRYDIMQERLKARPDLPLIDAVKPVILRNNIFECANGWDIDLDDGSSNYLIKDNLCLRGGIKNREGIYRTVVNNIMLNNTFHPHVWFEDSRDVFMNNLIFRPYADIGLKGWGKQFDYNVLYHRGEVSPAEVLQKKSGMDQHSVCAEITFEDVMTGGFLHISGVDFTDCGVQSTDLKKKAELPFKEPYSIEETPEVDNIIREFEGMKIKWLSGLGEISATGMYQETGVYILEVEERSTWYKRGLRSNDVILEVDNKEVKTVNDAIEKMKKKAVTLIIWRSQGKQFI